MYVTFKLLAKELQRNASVQAYNITSEQIITSIKILPVQYRPSEDVLDKDTLYLCEYWQLKRLDPHAELPPIVCVVEPSADTNAVMFLNRSCAVVYGSTLMEVLLALTNSAYDLGSKSSLITEVSRAFLKCRSLGELIDEGYRALKNPIIVTDHNQKILHFIDPDRISSPIYRNILASEYLPVGHPFVSSLDISWNVVNAPFSADHGEDSMFPIICKPLAVGTVIIGYFHILHFSHRFEEQDISIADLLGNLLTIELWRTKRIEPRDPQSRIERFYRDILDNLLGTQDAVIARQRSIGLTFKKHIYALVFNLRKSAPVDSVNRIFFGDFTTLIQNTLLNCHAFLYKNSVFALLQSDTVITDLNVALAPLLPALRQYNLMAGMSNELPSILYLREAGYQCRKSLQLGSALNPEHILYRYQDYSLYYMVELCLKNESFGALCPPGLRKLLEHCKANGPELLDTLRVYLKCGRSKSSTAKEMFVHVNTVKYRMNQIQELIDLELSNDETALELMLAFKMFEYREKFQAYEPIIND